MLALSATECWTPPVPGKFSPLRPQTRCRRRQQAVDTGAGVLFIVKNYSGDRMNFEMATEILDRPVETVLIDDDVAVETRPTARGAAASPARCRREDRRRRRRERAARPRSPQSAWRPGQRAHPLDGRRADQLHRPGGWSADFRLGEKEMEMGVGIHGEPGRRRVPLAAAEFHRRGDGRRDRRRSRRRGSRRRAAARQWLRRHAADGALPHVQRRPTRSSRSAARASFARLSATMSPRSTWQGCSLTVSMLDNELFGLWDAPVETPALRWGR